MSEGSTRSGAQRRIIDIGNMHLEVAELGDGPLVVLLHGFPESWYSWRHQMAPLAAAGYRVVAPAQRGYGRSDAPPAVDAYTQLHLVGDLIGLLDGLGESTAVIVGHDWGAPVAWNAAALRPDRFRAVVGMSVPFYGIQRSTAPPTAGMAELARDRFVYILYFQEPGEAEAELEADVRATLRRMMYSISGDIPESRFWNRPVGSTFLDTTIEPDNLPAWLSDDDLDVFTAEFERSGFRGGLNYYRNIDRNAELMAPFAGRTVEQPAMFIGGERDIVLGATPETVERMRGVVPGLRRIEWLAGCGHWLQQERPADVNRLLLEFLGDLDR
ncbi:MAG TPA: alpha/beta hydrolase [Acidimicrobiales bacterium]|jgi:pimeloyl-ACP methyl ester carboxylesterase